MWNPVPSYLIWSVKCSYSVCTVKAISLQIRPVFSKFPLNPPEVIGQMKLNWIKENQNNPKPSFPTPEFLPLITYLQHHHSRLLHVEFLRREKQIDAPNFFFFFNTEDATCLLRKGQDKMSPTEADLVPRMFFNMAHSSYWLWVSWECLHP